MGADQQADRDLPRCRRAQDRRHRRGRQLPAVRGDPRWCHPHRGGPARQPDKQAGLSGRGRVARPELGIRTASGIAANRLTLRSASMPHINLDNDAAGIGSWFRSRPETARPMSELAEVLLRGPSTLSRGERELIASYVSSLNSCVFCTSSHAAFAAAQLPGGMALVDQVRADASTAPVPEKLRALLRIAAAVQRGGKNVSAEEVAAARDYGATDLEIHDTVLI